MANSLKTLAKDGTWLELTGGGVPATSFAFQNRGPASIEVQYGVAAAPADVNGAKARGVVFKPGQGDKLVILQRVWARAELANAEVGSVAEVTCQEV